MFKFLPHVDKKFILSKLSQEEIFEKYIGEQVSLSRTYRSPLREDLRPTCSFKYLGDILLLKDWAGHFTGDCFRLVSILNNNCTYNQVYKIIANDFNIISNGKKGESYKRKPVFTVCKTTKADIKVKWRSFDSEDIAYWQSFGISMNTLVKFNIGAVDYVWLNNVILYKFSSLDRAYCYWFSSNDMKVYFPFRKEYRFLGNTSVLQGYDQLPEYGDLLVITKSLKDVALLSEYGISAVAPPSESSIITEEEHADLSKRFKTIVTLYDFDLTGIRSSNKMKKKYNYKIMFLTNGRFKSKDYGAKDLTDLYKIKGDMSVESFITNIINI